MLAIISEMTFIYGLVDPLTGRIRYIGKSSDLTRRLHDHLYMAGQNPHKDSWIRQLRDVGLCPDICVLEQVPITEWATAERRWIQHGRDYGWPLTNIAEGGNYPSFKGLRHSAEVIAVLVKRNKAREWPLAARERMADLKAGVPSNISEEERERRRIARRQANIGRVLSESARAKIGAATAARFVTEETREKIGAASRGKKRPAEVCAKIGAGRLGKRHTLESRAQMSASLRGHVPWSKGKHLSESTKQKMSDAQRAPYPAFTNRDTGECIPAGMNLSKVCRERAFNRRCMADVASGRVLAWRGWMRVSNEGMVHSATAC